MTIVPMTPFDRARQPQTQTMSTNNETPTNEYDTAAIGIEGFPLRDEPDDDLAVVLEEQKENAIAAVDEVTRALVNDDAPLTDRKVHELSEVGDALTALSRTLSTRVPDEYRAVTHEEYEEMYGDS